MVLEYWYKDNEVLFLNELVVEGWCWFFVYKIVVVRWILFRCFDFWFSRKVNGVI